MAVSVALAANEMRQMHGQSIGRTLTRRSLLAASGGMAWMIGLCPAIAQRLLTDATEWRKIMDIKRNGSRPSAKGPEAYFSGTVRVDPMFQVGCAAPHTRAERGPGQLRSH